MKLLIDGKVFDSTKTPVLIVFDENESEMFNGIKRFVSAPKDTTVEQRQKLIDTEILINNYRKTMFIEEMIYL